MNLYGKVNMLHFQSQNIYDTKVDKMVPYQERLPPSKSQDLWSRDQYEVIRQIEKLYIHFRKTYDH